MKKNLLLPALLLASAPMAAQGFDGTFDEPWETCYPDGKTAVGLQPKGWMASNVCKNFIVTVKTELVGKDTDRSGNANGHSVRMWNDFAGAWGIGATAPGYLTLGTSWAYGDVSNVGKPNDTSDGGAYGGVEFTSRPDSLTFYVKRTHAQEKPSNGSFNKEEKASVIFYMWKGHSVSKVTTGMSTSPVEMDMQDREKDILGKITEGVSGDAQLVASNEYYIEGDIAEWTRMSIAVDYKDKENKVYPEMMNIIFSASDYFNRPALGTGNDLTVDDVKLIYNTRLKSVTFGGEEVPGFDEGTFEYQLPADMQIEDIQAEAYGKDAQVEVATEGNVVTITVTDETAQGEKQQVYTFISQGQAPVAAQSFDGTFDGPWETCYPDGTTAVGLQPKGWMASSVCKNFILTITKELVGQEADRSGNANGHSVRMWNDYVGMFGIGATAPGYLTLGTSWAYGDVSNVGTENDTSDGGSYGGVEFSSRPDSLTFYVKRTHAQEEPSNGSFNKEEKATVVFYMWKGHSVSKVTTGMSNAPVEMDMQDREKDILGKITEGVSGDAQLVASNEYYIEGDIADWTRMSIAVDYKDKENKVYPEMMNIIFSASDYFNRPAMGTGNDLTVDDVKLIYNSRLKSVTFGGVEVPHFDDGTFEYQLAADKQSEDIQAEAYGKDAQVEVVTEGNVVRITVTDETAQGETKNVYTFTFKGQETVIETPEAAPAITYGDEGIDLGFKSNNPGAWEYSFSTEGVLEQGEDGKLSAVSAGEVIVTVNQAGTDEFAPAVSESLTVTVDKAPLTVALADTSWCWRGVSVSTSNVTNGKCAYGFAMNGLKGRDEGKTAEEIFSTLPTVRATAVDGEKPGDKRVATLSGGAADNYELTFAENNQLNIVKNKVGVYVRYASHTLSTAYSGENYRTVKVAAGQDEYYFTVNYADACEGDAEILEAAGMPEVVCGVTKEAQIGEEFPVSVVLSQTEFEDFDVVSIVPETAKVVVAANPNVTVAAVENVKYGDVFKLEVSNEGGISSYSYTSLNSVASVNYSGNVTVASAGEAALMVTTSSRTVEGTEYGATTTRVVFEAQKAPLTVKAKDVTVDVADGLPEVFELEYEGWVGDDTEETVFTTAPVASVELPGGLAVGTYPIVVTVSEEPENYEVQAVNGTLTVTNADGVDAVTRGSGKVTYANGNLYVPCGGNVEVYSLTGALVGQYEGTVIPVALRANTLYIVKTQEGAYRILVK